MSDTPKMEVEMEYKFDVHVYHLGQEVAIWLQNLLKDFSKQDKNFRLCRTGDIRQCDRRYVYFDTANFNFLEEGTTLREVSGFDDKRFRYDYKKGKVNTEERTQVELWVDAPLSTLNIIGLFSLMRLAETFKSEEKHLDIMVVARASSRHYKFDINFIDCTKIEVSVDSFHVGGYLAFQEMEIELKEGSIESLEIVRDLIEKNFGFSLVLKQKYQRVIENSYMGHMGEHQVSLYKVLTELEQKVK